MTHGQFSGVMIDRGVGFELGERGQKGKNWDNCDRVTIKIFKNMLRGFDKILKRRTNATSFRFH